MSDLLEKGLLKYKKNQKYAAIDMETENLNLLTSNRPWQLGYTISNFDSIVENNDKFIFWPDLNLSKDATRITNFSQDEYYKKAEHAEEILNFIESYLYNPEYRILLFNGLNFDIYIHNIWRKYLNKPTDYSYLDRVIDVRAIYVATKLGYNLDINEDFYFWQQKMLNFHQRGFKSNLALACKEYGIEVDTTQTHRGSYDTYLTLKLFLELIKVCDIT